MLQERISAINVSQPGRSISASRDLLGDESEAVARTRDIVPVLSMLVDCGVLENWSSLSSKRVASLPPPRSRPPAILTKMEKQTLIF